MRILVNWYTFFVFLNAYYFGLKTGVKFVFLRILTDFGIANGRQLKDYPCAFVYNSTETKNGNFHSPNYPGFYPRDTECHYFFHAEDEERVEIVFQHFQLYGKKP